MEAFAFVRRRRGASAVRTQVDLCSDDVTIGLRLEPPPFGAKTKTPPFNKYKYNPSPAMNHPQATERRPIFYPRFHPLGLRFPLLPTPPAHP